MMRLAVDAKADQLIRLYMAAEARLQALVTEAIASGSLGTTRYRQTRLAAVQAELAALQADAIPEATQLVADSYLVGADIAGLRGDVTDFGKGIHAEALDMLADNLAGSLNDAAERVGRQVDDVFRREGLRHAALGLIEGGTRRDTSARFADALRAQGTSAFTDRAGRQWQLEAYAAMAVRTTSREAVTTATKNRLLEQGTDLVEVVLSDLACPRCIAAYKGKTFSLTGTTEGYPVLETPPPLHPNDRCVLVASGRNLDALERELGLVTA